MPRVLVICDLDKTLIRVNTSFHFGKYLWHSGKLTNLNAAALIKYYLCHFLGFDSSNIVHQKSFEILFKGESFHQFDEIAHAFASNLVKNETAPLVEAFINEKKRQGAYMCLLSTGPDIIVKHFGALFGFDAIVGTSYLCDKNGTFSHVGTVIDGTVKAKMAKEWIQQEDFEKTYALTDSIQDLELLKIVSDPIVVNPDSRLKKEARVRGFKALI